MKARLPQGYGKNSSNNIQKLAMQAQQMQSNMDAATKELEEKEYTSTSGGGAVKVVTKGSFELESIKIDPDVVDKDDLDMLSDMIIAAVNESIRLAKADKDNVMDEISSKFNLPGMF